MFSQASGPLHRPQATLQDVGQGHGIQAANPGSPAGQNVLLLLRAFVKGVLGATGPPCPFLCQLHASHHEVGDSLLHPERGFRCSNVCQVVKGFLRMNSYEERTSSSSPNMLRTWKSSLWSLQQEKARCSENQQFF